MSWVKVCAVQNGGKVNAVFMDEEPGWLDVAGFSAGETGDGSTVRPVAGVDEVV